MKKMHKNNSKCDQCDETFKLNIQLEKDLISHKKDKFFNCDSSDKTFYLEWRLQKHIEGHNAPLKYCHYYNNKLGQSCAKLCSSFENFASNIYTLTAGWLGGRLAGWVVQL